VATYKVIQDIEAEDKILGPLTLRQFIFAIISIFLFYICAILVRTGVWPLLVIFVPPALFFGFFALPFGRDQPTEIWALAKLRYYFKPRKRIWNQSGVKELVTITVPKRVERVLSSGMSQTEVKSRLQALANTIDSRGWVVKNVDVNSYNLPSSVNGNSERLLDIATLPQAVPDGDIMPSDDILDEYSNPIAQQFSSMIDQSSRDHRQQLVDVMNDVPSPQQPPAQAATPPADYWFMNDTQMSGSAMPAPPSPLPLADSADEAALTAELHDHSKAKAESYGNMRTMKPDDAVAEPVAQAASTAVTPPTDPAILSLANNNDLNVATLAREAKKARGDDSGNEVVIPLR